MNTAKELWEQNRNDETVKKLNDALSKTSESHEQSSSEKPSGGRKEESVLFGMNPKHVQTLNPKRDGETK